MGEPAEVIEPGTVETVRVEAVLRRDVYRRALPDPFPDLGDLLRSSCGDARRDADDSHPSP